MDNYSAGMWNTLFVVVFFSFVLFPFSVFGAEGGSSHYLPGVVGDILIAQSPKPGLQVGMTGWYQNGAADSAVLQGRVGLDIDLDIFLAIPAASSPVKNQF